MTGLLQNLFTNNGFPGKPGLNLGILETLMKLQLNKGETGDLISGGGFGGGQGGFHDILKSTLSQGGSTGGLVTGGLDKVLSGAGISNPTALYGMAGNLAGNKVIGSGTDKEGVIDAGAAKVGGALKGAGTGALLGTIIPGGSAIGALAGALIGGLSGKGNETQIRHEQMQSNSNAIKDSIASHNVLGRGISGNYLPGFGGNHSGWYAYGGDLIPQTAAPEYKVEHNETIYAPDGNPPVTDGHGMVEKLGKNMYKFKGDKHSDPSGGIGVAGGNTPFMGPSGDMNSSGFIFSEKLKTDASQYLESI